MDGFKRFLEVLRGRADSAPPLFGNSVNSCLEHILSEVLPLLLILSHPAQHQVAEFREVNQAIPANTQG